MTPRNRAHSILAASVLAAACVIAPAAAHADPLAVFIADPGATAPAHPDAGERTRLADAVSTALGRSLADVLSAGESHSRIEVLDPSLLACNDTTCGARVATAMHARAVVQVRPTVSGAAFHLELVAIDGSGHEVARQSDDTTLSDWDDAVALAGVLAERLLPALRPPPTAGGGVGGNGAVQTRAAPRIPEVIIGAVLIAGGIGVGIVPTLTVAQGKTCEPTDACNAEMNAPGPTPTVTYSTPSTLAWVGMIGGGVGIAVGIGLLIHGMMGRETVPAAAGATAGASARRTSGPRILGLTVNTTGQGTGMGVAGVF